MRPIDADRLLSEQMKSKYYHLPNGDIAIPIIDIEHAPTISTARSGKWIIEDDHMECNACGWLFEYYAGAEEDCNYCPHCGADMRGGHE